MPPRKKKEDCAATKAEEDDDGFPSEETFKAQLEKNPDGKIASYHIIYHYVYVYDGVTNNVAVMKIDMKI